MSKSAANASGSEETALQLLKESFDEELNAVAHVFVVFGASVRQHHWSVTELVQLIIHVLSSDSLLIVVVVVVIYKHKAVY